MDLLITNEAVVENDSTNWYHIEPGHFIDDEDVIETSDLSTVDVILCHSATIFHQTCLDTVTHHCGQTDFCIPQSTRQENNYERLKPQITKCLVLWADRLPRKHLDVDWDDDTCSRNVNILTRVSSEQKLNNKHNCSSYDEQMCHYQPNKTDTGHKLLEQVIFDVLEQNYSGRKIVLSNTDVNKNRPSVLGPSRFGS